MAVPPAERMPDTAAAVALQALSLRGPVACVDLETTGGMAAQHRVIEVGIVLLEHGEVVEEWSTLVHPGIRIPSLIASFTGIDDSMVADAPPFADVAREVRRRLEGRLFVAHNARFDYGFLRAEFRRLGVHFAAPVLCTVKLSRALYAEHARHNLDTLMDRFGLSCLARHRALGDAQVLPALMAAMENQRGAAAMHAAVTDALRDRFAPALAAGTGRRSARGPGRVPVPWGRRDAAVRWQEPQHPQSRVRPLRRPAPLRQGIETDAAGPPGRMDRDRRRVGGAPARVAPGEGSRADGESTPAPSRRRLRRPPVPGRAGPAPGSRVDRGRRSRS